MEGLPQPFKIGDYFAKSGNGHGAKLSLSPSEIESMKLKDILALADDDSKQLWDNLVLSYPDFAGNPILRQEVAKLYELDKDDILILGPQDGIYIALNCLIRYLTTKNNDEIIHTIYTYPAYQSLSEPLRYNKCQYDKWEIKDTEDGWKADMTKLRSLLKPNTRLIIVNFPNSPTGYTPSKEQWEELIEICREREIFLFSDEIYWWINDIKLTSACMLYDKAITLCGLAKTCGLPGTKVGWLCVKNKELRTLMKTLKDYTTHINCTPGEILGIIALRNIDKILQESQEIIKTNREIADAFFKKHPDLLQWHSPVASTHGLAKLKGWLLEVGEGGAEGLCKSMIDNGVMLLPATVYNYHKGDEYVRIGYGRRNFPQCLEALEKFLERHGKKN